MKIENGILMSIEESDIKNGVLKLPKKVKEIANEVILNEKELTKVIALGLEKIGNDNFRWCKALTSFNAPILAQIGNDNFRWCNALTSFNAPILEQIGNDNFRWCNALTTIKIKDKVLNVRNVDGYCFVIESEKNIKEIIIYLCYNFNGTDANGNPNIEKLFVVEKNGFTAHGKTLKKAIEDVNFKVVTEKLKKEPINADTELTIMHYRTITGACEFGCKDFMEKNKIQEPMKAKDLLPILEKNGAYGIEKFKSLINF